MNHILLHLEGVLQSWAAAGGGFKKGTNQFPTRSGVVGLVAAALGLDRSNPLVEALHQTLHVSTRILREGTSVVDYQNVRNWTSPPELPPEKIPPEKIHKAVSGVAHAWHGHVATVYAGNPNQVWRTYLADAAFQGVLTISDACPFPAAEILAALKSPTMPLYLGRKVCVPSYPVVGRDDQVVEAKSPLDVFGDLSPHVIKMATAAHKVALRDLPPETRDRIAAATIQRRYSDMNRVRACLDLPDGVPPPVANTRIDGSALLPVRVADVVLSNSARSFATRTAYVWTGPIAVKSQEAA